MKNILLLIISLAVLFSCSSSDSENIVTQPPNTEQQGDSPTNDGGNEEGNGNTRWSIPVDEVIDGGPGKDGIPALTRPEFISTGAATYLDDDDLVIGFKNQEEVRAYPHIILDWHEIVNDKLNMASIAITYCPLTGTGIGWNRKLNGTETTFGVSGLLYNTNLIPYDRATDSRWSQILNECVNGELIGEKVELFKIVEISWGLWKNIYPESKVLSIETGHSRPYGVSPYGDYATNNDRFLFPVPKDERLPAKERVHAITYGDRAEVYRFSDFGNGKVIREILNGEDYVIIGNSDFIISFKVPLAFEELEFEYDFNGSEIVMKDQEGNQWNLFGLAVAGPKSGQALEAANSFMGYWFSIPAFYTTEIHF